MANAEGIRISTAEVSQTAGTIRTLNDSLTAKLEDIQNQMHSLESTWQSPAGQNIRQKFDALANKAFGNYRDIINAYATFLDNTVASYEQTETTINNNADAFN